MAERDKQSAGVKTDLSATAYQLTYRSPVAGQPGSIVQGNGADWFGPLNPMAPTAPINVKGRILDFPSGYNLNVRPRSYEHTTFEMLRAFADNFDYLRLLIENRKDQLSRLSWNIVPRDKKLTKKGATVPADIEARITEIKEFFLMPDKENFWDEWLSMLLEDLFVIDAPTLYRRPTLGGQLYALQPLDGGTIKRVIDDWGNTPVAPAPAYQQVLKGYPAVDYTTEELIYRPRVKRTHKVYGFSPVEQVLMTINIAMRRQTWQLQSFTEGNVPEALIGTPATWTPDQVRQFQDWFDSMLQGNTGERRRARFVPGDVAKGYIPTKPTELFGAAEEWLIRVLCFAFSISPQAFVKEVNRATAETAQETAALDGLAPIQNWVRNLMNFILINDFKSPDLEFKWEEDEELDPDKKSQIIDREQAAGRLTYNEARREQGLDTDDHPNADRAMFKTATGWEPIFLTPEEEAEKKAMAAQIVGAPGEDGTGKPGEPGKPGDGGDGPPKPPNGSAPPPSGGEVAEKSDRPFHQHEPGCGCGLAKAGRVSNSSYADPLRPFAAKHEKRLSRSISAVLSKLGQTVARQVEAKLNAVAKAEYPDDFDLDALLRDLNLDVLASTEDDLIEALSKVGVDSGRIALAQIGTLADDGKIVERVNERALNWARDRAAELVGVSDNEAYSLDDSTREMIRSIIADGIENNLATSEIGDILEEAYAFSDDRAQLIAATEITSANSEGALVGYQEAKAEGVNVKKSWLVLEDGCDICQENADAGPIDLDDSFPSGDDAPGAHPKCRCVLVPEVVDEEGGSDDGSEGGDVLEMADQPRNLRGRFTRDPGESFMPGMVAGIPGVKAKIGHIVTELAGDADELDPKDDVEVD